MSNLKGSLNWLALPTESLGYTTFRGVYVKFSLLLLAPPTEILGFTLLMGVQGYKQNHRVTLQLWERHLKCTLCWLPLVSESLGYTIHMGVHPKGSSCWLALPRKSLGYTTLMGV